MISSLDVLSRNPLHWRVNRAHPRPVLSVAFGTLPDGATVLASAAADGTVRLWDPTTGTPRGEPLTGHGDWVRSVAFGTLPDGNTVLASASDGTVRLWDATTGTPRGEPLTDHNRRVLSVAFGTTLAGSPVLASGTDEGTVRLWDLADPTATPTVLTGHTGEVWSVAFGTLPDGATVLASAGHDGTVRLWDPATGTPHGEPLTGHTGEVWSVAFGTLPDGATVLASAGDAGRIDIRAVTSGGAPDGAIPVLGKEPPEPSPSPLAASRAALVSSDDEETADTLGRQVLAGHLAGVLQQLAGSRGGRDRSGGTVVISVDGRWGSGKSVLARLCAEQLAAPASPDAQPGGSAAAPATTGSGDIHDPVLVWFDAWRESSVGPRWWALGAALKRGVESERAGGTRMAMAGVGLWHRLVRSRAVALAAVAVLLAWWLSRSSSWDTLSKVIAAATTASGLAIGLGRALFWASPVVGKLYLTADGNPLDEISGIVARLRRWSPRQGRRHRLADTLLGIWIVLTSAYLVDALAFDSAARGTVSGVPRWVTSTWAGWWPAILAGLGVGMLTSTALHASAPPSAPAQGANRPGGRVTGANLPGERVPGSPWSTTGLAAVSVAAAVAAMLAVQGLPRPVWLTTHAVVVGAVALVAGAAAYLWWVSRGLDQPRRPILLVIDDLDRCSAEDTVDYLETVHTLLRYNPQPRILARWRQPAPLLVLALGDGRWVRQAFEKRYETFAPLGDPARNLGADFIQKLFDHTVLVPELTQEQVRRYVALVTDSPTTSPGDSPTSSVSSGSPAPSAPEAEVGASAPAEEPSSGESTPRPAPTAATEAAAAAAAGAAAAPPYQTHPSAGRRAEAAGSRRPTPALPPEVMRQIERDTAEARSKASEAVVAERSQHLLSGYPDLMPANPRLIRRVVNMWGMLEALKLHLRHGHDDEALVRAAVFFVRFPTLVDELISTQTPPSPGDLLTDRWATPDPDTTQWRRRDVLEVLRLGDGTSLAPKTLGECYGRQYPAASTSTPAPESVA